MIVMVAKVQSSYTMIASSRREKLMLWDRPRVCALLQHALHSQHAVQQSLLYRFLGCDCARPHLSAGLSPDMPFALQLRAVDVAEGRRHLYQTGILMPRARAI